MVDSHSHLFVRSINNRMDRIQALTRHLTASSTSSSDQVFTKQNLAKFNGRDNDKIYIALKGTYVHSRKTWVFEKKSTNFFLCNKKVWSLM